MWTLGQGRVVREGSSVAILSLGPRLGDALRAADELAARGLATTVADARFAKPLDAALVEQLAKHHEVLITIEEGSIGGFGSAVLHHLAWKGLLDGGLKVRPMVLPDWFIDHEFAREATRGGEADGEGHRRHGVGGVRARGATAADGERWLIALAALATGLSGVGVVQAIAGWVAVRRFVNRPLSIGTAVMPGVSVLKPLHGDEPLLEDALASICHQDFPRWQVVFGVQDPADTALPVVRRLQARFPDCDIAVVVDPTGHGRNPKVANLINMLPAATTMCWWLPIPICMWLRTTCGGWSWHWGSRGTGLATTLYVGLPLPPAASRRGWGSPDHATPLPLVEGRSGDGSLSAAQ